MIEDYSDNSPKVVVRNNLLDMLEQLLSITAPLVDDALGNMKSADYKAYKRISAEVADYRELQALETKSIEELKDCTLSHVV